MTAAALAPAAASAAAAAASELATVEKRTEWLEAAEEDEKSKRNATGTAS